MHKLNPHGTVTPNVNFDEQMYVTSYDMFLCLFPEGTAAGAGEAASGPVEDSYRGEFSRRAAIRLYSFTP